MQNALGNFLRYNTVLLADVQDQVRVGLVRSRTLPRVRLIATTQGLHSLSRTSHCIPAIAIHAANYFAFLS